MRSISRLALTRTFLMCAGLAACGGKSTPAAVPGGGWQRGGAGAATGPKPPLLDPREKHLADLTQLTFGGENAEAYWSSDGTELIMQSTHDPYKCDQIFRMPALEAGDLTLVSTGKGRTTCSYFFPGDQRILFASTHAASPDCPAGPDRSHGYTWALYDSYDIFQAKPDGTDLKPLITSPGYDAEATVCPKDGTIIFTSTRDGDIDLYKANADGSNVVRMTNLPGYDGGAFFNADCSKIVWRAQRPQDDQELADFKKLLGQGLVRPTKLELWTMNADGSEQRQITYLDAASFAPYFYPSGNRIIFSSNYGDPKGREFDIWAVDTDGSNLERITYAAGFDGFPMFSPDGSHLSFSSNRNGTHEGETDVFVARWVDGTIDDDPTPADRVMTDDRWLADDARQGRGVGTQGLVDSRDYLVKQFKSIGLEPVTDGYLYPFEVTTGEVVNDKTTVSIDGKALAKDAFVPLGFSAVGDASGDIVMAGYGVTATEIGWDDYKGVNAKGKIVVVRRFVPEGGKFEDDKLQRRYGDLRYKAWNAREHGAKAVIIVDAAETTAKKGAKAPPEAPLPKLAIDAMGDAGLPVIAVTRAVGNPLFGGKKHTGAMTIALDKQKQTVHDVIGRISAPAEGKLPGIIVIGAHYDHLGLGGPASLAPGVSEPHNGADDNASGTSALLEVARQLVARKSELKRDVWIVSFSAEEMGVLGSSALVKAMPGGVAIGDVVAMLNMDMVGRLRQNKLTILGGESAKEWKELVPPLCKARKIFCTLGGDGYGPSDHMPFYAAGVPVLHFFSGAHGEYHKPSDDSNLINGAGMGEIALLVADTALAVAARPGKLTLEAAPPQLPGGDMRSFGASLGTVPDYAGPPEGKKGVLLAGVRPGSPAEKAGLMRGDLLQGINGHKIDTVEDFMFVLRKSRPGEKATLTIERDGKQMTLETTFGQSQRQ
jgi:Tol biopolymer transport system component